MLCHQTLEFPGSGAVVSPRCVIAVSHSRDSQVDPKSDHPASMNPYRLKAQTLSLAACKMPKILLSPYDDL